jgi:hypothetical protein
MKKIVLLGVCVGFFSFSGHAQLLKKLKDKVNEAAGNKTSQTTTQTNQNNSTGNTNSGSPVNKTGGASPTPRRLM